MNREAIGHVAAGIVRTVTQLARIGVNDRQKTILVIEACTATDWASLTFDGQQHRLTLRLQGQAAAVATALASIEADLSEAEITLPGQFVAEVRVTDVRPPLPADQGEFAQSFCVEALVLRD